MFSTFWTLSEWVREMEQDRDRARETARRHSQRLSLCMFECVCVWMCVCARMSVCVNVCVHACVCVNVCVYVCKRACMRLFLWFAICQWRIWIALWWESERHQSQTTLFAHPCLSHFWCTFHASIFFLVNWAYWTNWWVFLWYKEKCHKKRKSLYRKEWKQLWTKWKRHLFPFWLPSVKCLKNYSITLYIYASICTLFWLERMCLQYRKRKKSLCFIASPILDICMPHVDWHNYASWF